MPLPTPRENAANYPINAVNAGVDWKTLPTTDETEARAVTLVAQKYGQAFANQFKTWYDAARLQDPNITPTTAVLVFVVGDTTAQGIAKTANFLTGSPANVTSGGGAQPSVDLGTQSGSIGVIQAAVNAAGSLNNGWLGFVIALEQIWAGLTDGKMWRSLGWLLLGTLLIVVGAALWAGMSGKLPPVIPI